MPRRLICGLVFATCIAASTHASITITNDNGSPVPNGTTTVTFNPGTGGWTITLHTLYNPGGETVYNIHGNAGDVIDEVIIDVPCWEGPDGECVPAGSPVIVRVLSDAPGGVHSVGSIMQTGDAETILANVVVNQDLGPVAVEVIGILDVGRDITGTILAFTEDNPGRGITLIEVGRDILGDLLAPNGRIVLILAMTGSMGKPNAPIQVEAKHNILQIGAASIYANVDAHVNGGAGGMYAFGAYNFVGTVHMRRLIQNPYNKKNGRIFLSVSWSGLIVLDEPLTPADFWIELPPAGLTGQIIANAGNFPDPVWETPVFLGPKADPETTLIDPTYPQIAATLGGGSVGMAPFYLHGESCSPPNGSQIDIAGGEMVEVNLRHYGPVTWKGVTPIVISRRAAGSADPYLPISLGQFQIDPAAGDSNSLTVSGLGDVGAFEPGYDYRIQPTSALTCDLVAGSPSVVPWMYELTVNGDTPPQSCVGDLDGNGQVNASDLAAALGAWGPCPGCQADINDDGFVNASDLALILGNWGPCSDNKGQ